MRRRMVVMATMLLLSLAGSRVDGAATCSYLPDTSQLSCSLPSPTNLTTVLGEEERTRGEGRTLSLILTCPESTSTSTSSLHTLPRMPHLESLQVEGCPHSPLPPLGLLLPGLQQLKVQNKDVKDLEACSNRDSPGEKGGLGDQALQGLHQLRHLEVTGQGVTFLDRSTFCPGLALASLASLNFSHNCLSSLPPL